MKAIKILPILEKNIGVKQRIRYLIKRWNNMGLIGKQLHNILQIEMLVSVLKDGKESNQKYRIAYINRNV